MEDNFAGIADVLKEAKPSQKVAPKPINLQKALASGFTNQKAAAVVEDLLLKDLRSTDLQAYRMVNFNDQVDRLADDTTMFMNLCESNGVLPTTDLQIQWIERSIGTDVAENVNLNVDAFASETVSDATVRTQTLGFQGTKCKVRILAQQLGLQSQLMSVDAKAQEILDCFIRIRRLQEQQLLSNEEVTTEGLLVAPTFGGFINRSTLYSTGLVGDITSAAIQGRVDAIANLGSTEALGYNINLLAFLPSGLSAQIEKIRNLMATRYPGEASTDALAYQDKLKALFGNSPVSANAFKAYQPDPGAAVLFTINDKMPADTILFFDPSAPKLFRFAINGQYGPWGIERPTEEMVMLEYCLDGISLRDGQIARRATLLHS